MVIARIQLLFDEKETNVSLAFYQYPNSGLIFDNVEMIVYRVVMIQPIDRFRYDC